VLRRLIGDDIVAAFKNNNDIEHIYQFLAGCIDGDGDVTETAVRISASRSKKIITKVLNDLSLTIGISIEKDGDYVRYCIKRQLWEGIYKYMLHSERKQKLSRNLKRKAWGRRTDKIWAYVSSKGCVELRSRDSTLLERLTGRKPRWHASSWRIRTSNLQILFNTLLYLNSENKEKVLRFLRRKHIKDEENLSLPVTI